MDVVGLHPIKIKKNAAVAHCFNSLYIYIYIYSRLIESIWASILLKGHGEESW